MLMRNIVIIVASELTIKVVSGVIVTDGNRHTQRYTILGVIIINFGCRQAYSFRKARGGENTMGEMNTFRCIGSWNWC